MNEQARNLKLEVLKRVEDLAAQDSTSTAVALVDAALAILARQFPATLSDYDRSRVQDNYPHATDELVAERAMSQEGVVTAVAAGIQMATIAMDYSPLSHAKEDMDRDFALSQEVMAPIVQAGEKMFVNGPQAGLSVFGVAALMIHLASQRAVELGVHRLKIARPLLEALGNALDSGASTSTEELDELMIATLRERMGISREVAKRYVKLAKEKQGQQ